MKMDRKRKLVLLAGEMIDFFDRWEIDAVEALNREEEPSASSEAVEAYLEDLGRRGFSKADIAIAARRYRRFFERFPTPE